MTNLLVLSISCMTIMLRYRNFCHHFTKYLKVVYLMPRELMHQNMYVCTYVRTKVTIDVSVKCLWVKKFQYGIFLTDLWTLFLENLVCPTPWLLDRSTSYYQVKNNLQKWFYRHTFCYIAIVIFVLLWKCRVVGRFRSVEQKQLNNLYTKYLYTKGVGGRSIYSTP